MKSTKTSKQLIIGFESLWFVLDFKRILRLSIVLTNICILFAKVAKMSDNMSKVTIMLNLQMKNTNISIY